MADELRVTFATELFVRGDALTAAGDGTSAAADVIAASFGSIHVRVLQRRDRMLTVEIAHAFDENIKDAEIRAWGEAFLEYAADLIAVGGGPATRLSRDIACDVEAARRRLAHRRNPTGVVAGEMVAARWRATGETRQHLDVEQVVRALAVRLVRPVVPLLRFYRAVVENEDPLGRFVLAYAFLSDATNAPGAARGAQQRVDAFILSAEPGVAMTPAPSGPRRGQPETVYTAIRNELAHAEERQTPLDAAQRRAERHSAGLVEIARRFALSKL